MTKQQVIEQQLAERTDTTKAEAKRNLEALTPILSEALQNGERAQLPGLGSFDIQESAALTGRNPRNGEPLQMAKKKVRFKAGYTPHDGAHCERFGRASGKKKLRLPELNSGQVQLSPCVFLTGVGLSTASPRSSLAVGFPLLSLTH